MKNIIQFHVHKGEKYYIAEGVGIPVVTQGKTLDDLAKNVKEALELQLDGESLVDFDLSSDSTILMNFELGKAYA